MSGEQLGLSDYALTSAKEQIKQKNFLSETEVVLPWQALLDLIGFRYAKTSKKGGRQPYLMAAMLRIHDETKIHGCRHLLEK